MCCCIIFFPVNHTQARTRARTHKRARTHTHTDTHTNRSWEGGRRPDRQDKNTKRTLFLLQNARREVCFRFVFLKQTDRQLNMQTLPASMMPCARIAPNLAMTSSCLSLITLAYSWRKCVTWQTERLEPR